MKASSDNLFSSVILRCLAGRKFFWGWLVLGFAGLFLLTACGGDGSSGPQLELSTEAIQTTHVLGSEAVVTDIALRNIGDEQLTFSLGGPSFWIEAANAASGEIAPGEEAIIQFTLECSVPGDIAGSITVSGNFGSDASFSASLDCQAPPITVALAEPIPDSIGHPRLDAQSTMQWSIASIWSGQPAVDYTIVSSNGQVTVDPTSGTVELDSPVEASLDIACPAPSDQDVELRVEAGDGLLDAVWSVDCQGGSGEVRRVEIYQGPMAVRERYEEDDSGESGTFTRKTFAGLVPGRDGVITMRVEHETDYLGELAFSILDGSGASHPIEPETLSTSDPEESASGNYEVEFMFPVSRSLFVPDSILRADIDIDGSDEGALKEHTLALNELSFHDSPSIIIRLFPVENGEGVPEIENLDNFMNSLMSYMPLSNLEIMLGEVINHTGGGRWSVIDALRALRARWQEEGEANEYYHGSYIYDNRGILGVAYAPGNVGFSVDPFSYRQGLVADNSVFAHEMGHNFSLLHSPCGGPAQVDRNYPYDGARLGPRRGWKFLESRFIEANETYYDIQAYCNPTSVSDYSFNKAGRHLSSTLARLAAQPPQVPVSNAGDYVPLTRTGTKAQSLALWGDVDDQGQWSFSRAVYSDRNPLPIDVLGMYSHIVKIFDVDGTEIFSHFLSPSEMVHGTGFGWGYADCGTRL